MKLFVIMIVTTIFVVTSFGNAFAKDYSEWLHRCEPYKQNVIHLLRNEGVNTDFYYLMVAESKCTNDAKSSKGALGFWQLMPFTARHYGCSEPNDIECSTKAAAKYLKHLSTIFRSFDDVVIAYNMGGHNYIRRGATTESKSLLTRVKALKSQDIP